MQSRSRKSPESNTTCGIGERGWVGGVCTFQIACGDWKRAKWVNREDGVKAIGPGIHSLMMVSFVLWEVNFLT